MRTLLSLTALLLATIQALANVTLVRDPISNRVWHLFVPASQTDSSIYAMYSFTRPPLCSTAAWKSGACFTNVAYGRLYKCYTVVYGMSDWAETGTWTSPTRDSGGSYWHHTGRSSSVVNSTVSISVPSGTNYITIVHRRTSSTSEAVWSISWSDDTTDGLDITSIDCRGTTSTITHFSNYTPITGTVLVETSTAHGFRVGDNVTISGTTNYNASQCVVAVPSSTTFVYNKAYVADDATGSCVIASGIYETAVCTTAVTGTKILKIKQNLNGQTGTIFGVRFFNTNETGDPAAVYNAGTDDYYRGDSLLLHYNGLIVSNSYKSDMRACDSPLSAKVLFENGSSSVATPDFAISHNNTNSSYVWSGGYNHYEITSSYPYILDPNDFPEGHNILVDGVSKGSMWDSSVNPQRTVYTGDNVVLNSYGVLAMKTLLDNAESVTPANGSWLGDTGTTIATSTSPKIGGSYSLKSTVDASLPANGKIIYKNYTSAQDWSGYSMIVVGYISSIDLSSSDIKLVISSADDLANPIVSYNMATTSNYRWEIVVKKLGGSPLTNVKSIGFVMQNDKGAFNFFVDELYAVSSLSPYITHVFYANANGLQLSGSITAKQNLYFNTFYIPMLVFRSVDLYNRIRYYRNGFASSLAFPNYTATSTFDSAANRILCVSDEGWSIYAGSITNSEMYHDNSSPAKVYFRSQTKEMPLSPFTASTSVPFGGYWQVIDSRNTQSGTIKSIYGQRQSIYGN